MRSLSHMANKQIINIKNGLPINTSNVNTSQIQGSSKYRYKYGSKDTLIVTNIFNIFTQTRNHLSPLIKLQIQKKWEQIPNENSSQIQIQILCETRDIAIIMSHDWPVVSDHPTNNQCALSHVAKKAN